MKYCLIFVVCLLAPFVSNRVSEASDARRGRQNGNAPFRLMSATKDEGLRTYLPRVDDHEVQAILDDPELILYTDAEMPEAYQDWSGGLPGIHSPDYNVSADRNEPFGNGNLEFPWNAPAGTHRTSNVSSFRFLRLPPSRTGRPLPIVWYRRMLRGSTTRGFAWSFPVGTVVGEVLLLRSPAGNQYTFELRLRMRDYGEWTVDVFRPFRTHVELAEGIKLFRPQWQKNTTLTKLVKHLEQPIRLKKGSLANAHPQSVFYQSAGIDVLPPIGDDQLVAKLLKQTPFRSAIGATWRTGINGFSTAAPTTAARFHIVPARYDAGFVEVDRFSCMRCHDTVNRHVNDFQFGRDWYGRIRGSDGIFSFHPFDTASISHNGMGIAPRMNQRLVAAGLLERFDRDRHSSELYQTLFDVKE